MVCFAGFFLVCCLAKPFVTFAASVGWPPVDLPISQSDGFPPVKPSNDKAPYGFQKVSGYPSQALYGSPGYTDPGVPLPQIVSDPTVPLPAPACCDQGALYCTSQSNCSFPLSAISQWISSNHREFDRMYNDVVLYPQRPQGTFPQKVQGEAFCDHVVDYPLMTWAYTFPDGWMPIVQVHSYYQFFKLEFCTSSECSASCTTGACQAQSSCRTFHARNRVLAWNGKKVISTRLLLPDCCKCVFDAPTPQSPPAQYCDAWNPKCNTPRCADCDAWDPYCNFPQQSESPMYQPQSVAPTSYLPSVSVRDVPVYILEPVAKQDSCGTCVPVMQPYTGTPQFPVLLQTPASYPTYEPQSARFLSTPPSTPCDPWPYCAVPKHPHCQPFPWCALPVQAPCNPYDNKCLPSFPPTCEPWPWCCEPKDPFCNSHHDPYCNPVTPPCSPFPYCNFYQPQQDYLSGLQPLTPVCPCDIWVWGMWCSDPEFACLTPDEKWLVREKHRDRGHHHGHKRRHDFDD